MKLSEISTRRLPRTVRAVYMGAAVKNSGAVIRLQLKPLVSLFISAK